MRLQPPEPRLRSFGMNLENDCTGSAAPRRRRRIATGRFATRAELTRNVWAIHRLQLNENLRAIAAACGASYDVVRLIIRSEEGLEEYLASGCRVGGG